MTFDHVPILLFLAAVLFYTKVWVPDQQAKIAWREDRYPDLAKLDPNID